MGCFAPLPTGKFEAVEKNVVGALANSKLKILGYEPLKYNVRVY
jgi:hypothetical protein